MILTIFPVELPYRLVQLYTFEGEVVLDPFVGGGASCIAALKSNRRYVGYEISQEYVRLAEERIRVFRSNSKAPVLTVFVNTTT